MKENVRINKYISMCQVASRRAADRMIAQGRITIDGRVAVLGDAVGENSVVCVDGKRIHPEEERILLLVNKPRGVVCTAQKKEKNNIVDFINYPKRIYPIGRLDKDSCGLILMTNEGRLHDAISRASNLHEKEYIVRVDKPVTAEFIAAMSDGVYLRELQYTTQRTDVKKLKKDSFDIVLREGKNRQIRRMCEELGYQVLSLKRIRIMHFLLDGIREGTYRHATEYETLLLNEAIE